jgi:glycosyltransferase involved in cell wall biosynthesis
MQSCQTDSRDRGIGRYAMSLASSLVQHKNPDSEVLLALDAGNTERTRDLRNSLRSGKVRAPATAFHYPSLQDGVTDDVAALSVSAGLLRSRFFQGLDPDALLVTSFFEGFYGGAGVSTALDAGSLGNVPKAVVAYDLIPLLFPENYLPANARSTHWYKAKLEEFRSFELYLAISDATRLDLIRQLGISDSRIRVIGAGLDQAFLDAAAQDTGVADTRLFSHLGIDMPFVLTVGNGDWRKNTIGALEAYAALSSAVRKRHLLVLTQVGDDVRRALATKFKSIASQVRILGRVSDHVLASLYRGCEVFLFPSLYEGFGLPVLEAMAFGAPVLSSDRGALPEVMLHKNALFDPGNQRQTASILNRSLTDAAFREGLREGVAAHASGFTWKRCSGLAQQALDELATSCNKPTVADLHWTPSSRDITALVDALEVSGISGEKSLIHGLESIADQGRRRILIDVTCVAITETRTGIQRVVRNYCTGLAATAKASGTFDVLPIRWTEDGIYSAVEFANAQLGLEFVGEDEPVVARSNDLLFMLDSTWELPERFDPLLHEVWAAGGEVVWMVYDLVPIRVPETCHPGMPPVFRSWLVHAIQRADGFICISEATRDDLEEFMDEVLGEGARRPWSTSVHLGSDLESGQVLSHSAAAEEALEAAAGKPLLLAIGTVEPRKNYVTILDAFELVWARNVDAVLVIVGKAGWNVETLTERLKNHAELNKRLFWFEHASDGDLQFLLSKSAALIQASVSEGFGLPIVEAGSRGIPLILSDIAVFHEIAGDEAEYFPSREPAALAHIIVSGSQGSDWKHPSGIHTMTWQQSSDMLAEALL